MLLASSCAEEILTINYGGSGGNNNYGDRSSLYSIDYFVIGIVDSNSTENKQGLRWPPLMKKNGGILWSGNDNKIKLLAGTRFRWEYDLLSARLVGPFAVSPTGDIIFLTSDNSVNSIDNSGLLNWKVSLSDSSEKIFYSSVLTTPDYIVVSNNLKQVLFIDYSGKITHTHTLPITPTGNPVLLGDSTIVVSASHFDNNKTDSLYLINNENILARIETKGARIIHPAISSASRIFVSLARRTENGKKQAFIICLDNKGKFIWESNIKYPAMGLSSDGVGNLYCIVREIGFTESKNWIIKINDKGEIVWETFFNNVIGPNLLIGKNNIAFFTSKEKSQGLVYIDKEDGKLYSTLSFGMAPELYPYPAVSRGGNVYFGAKTENKIIKIEKDMLDWR